MTRAQRRYARETRITRWERRLAQRPYPVANLPVQARKRARTPDPVGACRCCHRLRERYGPKLQERRQALRAFDEM